MNPDPPIEEATGAVPVRGRGVRLKSLMGWTVVIACGLGWVLHTDRTSRALRMDQDVFDAWIARFQADHRAIRQLANSVRSTSYFLEMGRNRLYQYEAPIGRPISIQAELRSGPLRSTRHVIFESAGRTVSWPFEDIERGRKVDLASEFPGAYR